MREDAAMFEQEAPAFDDRYWDGYVPTDAEELAGWEEDIAQMGIVGAIKYYFHNEREYALHEACRVVTFADDPITRSGSFDSYEMAGLSWPIVKADALDGCVLCLTELADLHPRTFAAISFNRDFGVGMGD